MSREEVPRSDIHGSKKLQVNRSQVSIEETKYKQNIHTVFKVSSISVTQIESSSYGILNINSFISVTRNATQFIFWVMLDG